MCYIDPPFNSKRNYFQIYNNQGSEDRAQAQAFVDTWEWGDEAEKGLDWITDIERLQTGKLATLNSDRQREGAEFGILITMDEPTRAMKDEITAAGNFKHPLLNREDDRLQVVTVEQLLAGARMDLPMARKDAVKSAKAEETNQPELF